MIGIEELTQEELVSWIRENVPGIDEGELVLQTLYHRSDAAWEKSTAASKKAVEINDRIIELFQPYADGPVKPGVRLRRFPVAVREEYNRLDRERRAAWAEWELWFGKYKDAGQKIRDLQKGRVDQMLAGLFEDNL